MIIRLLTCTALLALAIPSTGCGPGGRPDDDDADSSLCNGEQDVGEFSVDDTYDADGDGFFDPDDPGCAQTYDFHQLDCDDDNPLTNPDAVEVACNDADDDCDPDTADFNDLDADGYTDCDGDCDDLSQLVFPGATDEPCNGIDEDCTGSDEGPCDLNYSGTWDLTAPAQYSCGAAVVDISRLELNHSGDDIAVSPELCGGCTGPTNLQGDFTSATQFTAEQTQDAGSGCEKHFSMLGTFVGAGSVNGSLAINFAGADCSAQSCTGQLLTFAAVLQE